MVTKTLFYKNFDHADLKLVNELWFSSFKVALQSINGFLETAGIGIQQKVLPLRSVIAERIVCAILWSLFELVLNFFERVSPGAPVLAHEAFF